MNAEQELAECKERVARLVDRVYALRVRRDAWKQRARTAEARPFLRGRKWWGPEVEKWRGLVEHYMDYYANKYLGRDATEYEIDFLMGIIHHESRGNHQAISNVEWIGPPPPGYDGTAETRATGLVQHVPRYFYEGGRARAAGYEGWSIMDPVAQLGTVAWMIYDYWKVKPVPNFWHWPDAPDGTKGSTRKVMEELAPLYPELPGQDATL